MIWGAKFRPKFPYFWFNTHISPVNNGIKLPTSTGEFVGFLSLIEFNQLSKRWCKYQLPSLEGDMLISHEATLLGIPQSSSQSINGTSFITMKRPWFFKGSHPYFPLSVLVIGCLQIYYCIPEASPNHLCFAPLISTGRLPSIDLIQKHLRLKRLHFESSNCGTCSWGWQSRKTWCKFSLTASFFTKQMPAYSPKKNVSLKPPEKEGLAKKYGDLVC